MFNMKVVFITITNHNNRFNTNIKFIWFTNKQK